MSSFGEKKVEWGDNHQRSAPGHLINATVVWPIFLHSAHGIDHSPCPFVPNEVLQRTKERRNWLCGQSLVPSISTWRIVFTPEWHFGQGRSPVPCFCLLPTGRRACLASRPWFSLEKWGICPAWLCSYWGVASCLGLHAWPSLQIGSFVWGILLGCYGRLTPKETLLFCASCGSLYDTDRGRGGLP